MSLFYFSLNPSPLGEGLKYIGNKGFNSPFSLREKGSGDEVI